MTPPANDDTNVKAKAAALCERIELYGFQCEGGPLRNCVEWQDLRKLLDATFVPETERARHTDG